MDGVNHKKVGIAAGIAAGCILYGQTKDPLTLFVCATSAFGSMLPDIDHDRTKIGRKRKAVTDTTRNLIIVTAIVGVILSLYLVISGFKEKLKYIPLLLIPFGVVIALYFASKNKTIRWAASHRGIMHTLVVPILLFAPVITMSVSGLLRYLLIGLAVGYLSHLFADMLTYEGCPVLWPIVRDNIRFLSIRSKEKGKIAMAANIVSGVLIICGLYFLI